MPISELALATPFYVLIALKAPYAITVVDPESGSRHLAVFGFSDKTRFDKFSRESSIPLRPYPLVKDYLRSRLDAPSNPVDEQAVQFVILDAPAPREPQVHAATIQAVLDARESRATQIVPTHCLKLVPAEDVYYFDETPA